MNVRSQIGTGANSSAERMIALPGGSFWMGSESHYPEEAPRRKVRVDAFKMDRYAVTNAEYEAFVRDTGYVTVAERPLNPADFPGAKPELLKPGSLVFRMSSGPVDTRNMANWWAYVPGACWRHPEGPGSDLSGREHHPVIQVAYEDALAYAEWAGKDLPTEAEWEYAARGGLDGAEYVWGDEFNPDGRWMANTWQGEFPWKNTADDGFAGTAPVGSFPPNGFGLFDMAGNVWQWTQDWFFANHPRKESGSCCALDNPRGPPRSSSYDPMQPHIKIPRKVVKGGSFLCAASYCRRYRPAARHAQMVDSGMSHIGFRCIKRSNNAQGEADE
jgi:sulfatase modifying factor 1